MVHLDGAAVGVAFGEWGDHDLTDRSAGGIATLAFVPPDNNRAIILISLGGHDLRDHCGKEVIALGNGRLVAGVMSAVVGEAGAERAVLVVELIGGDPVVTSHGVAGEVCGELSQREDVLICGGVQVESLPRLPVAAAHMKRAGERMRAMERHHDLAGTVG